MLKIFLPEALFPTKKNTKKLLYKLGGKICDVFTENPTVFEHYQQLLKGFNNLAMGFHKIRRFTNEEIQSIHKKTCYLVGEDDPFIKYGGRKALIENKMDTKYFPNVGHGINHEIADEINEVIVEFFLG
jgi:pimeloyl-ACP methyl ester carboxylesterase